MVGLGVTGEAVVRYAAERTAAGGSAMSFDSITVVEDRPGIPGYDKRVSIVRSLGAEVVEAPDWAALETLVRGASLVVPSPGVPGSHAVYEIAASKDVPVLSEIELAAEAAIRLGRPIVAVTGTNGKTTVTTLITEMLTASGIRAIAAGNIGRPLLDAVHDSVDVVVAEVSSFQLAYTKAFRPRVGVLVNIAPDHQDWHSSFADYVEAKARIFANQTSEDLLVRNIDDLAVTEMSSHAPARVVDCSLDPASAGAWRVADGVLVTAHDDPIVGVDELSHSAPHDLMNALLAAAAAAAMGADVSGIKRALRSFKGLPHRVTFVGEAGGVRFYDDSKATNPHATLSALEGFESVVLIAGGRNKGLDLSALTQGASRVRAVVAIGDAAAEVEAAFSEVRPVSRASSMREAVGIAAAQASSGDVVLLSPACASFDWYSGYSQRGDDFASEVHRILQVGVTSRPGDEP